MERKQYAKLVPLVQNPSAVKTPKDLDLDEVAKAVAKSPGTWEALNITFSKTTQQRHFALN